MMHIYSAMRHNVKKMVPIYYPKADIVSTKRGGLQSSKLGAICSTFALTLIKYLQRDPLGKIKRS